MQLYIDAINASDRKPQYVMSYSLDYVRTDSAESAAKLIEEGYSLRAVCKDGVLTQKFDLTADPGDNKYRSRKAVPIFSVLANLPTLIPVDEVKTLTIMVTEHYSRPLVRRNSIHATVEATTTSGKKPHWELDDYMAEHICDIAFSYYHYFKHGEEELLNSLKGGVSQ